MGMKVQGPEQGRGRPGRALLVLSILAIIVLVTVFFAVRTEGGQAFVCDRLEQHLGLEVRVARVRIGWPYALVMEKVATIGFEDGAPGLAAQEIRVGPSFSRGWRVAARRPHLRLRRTPAGVWEPSYFKHVGEVPFGKITDLGAIGTPLGDRRPLTLTSGTIEWQSGTSTNMAAVYGMDYRYTPLNVPGHRLGHHRLTLYNRVGPGQHRASDLEYEWLSSKELPYVGLIEPRDRGGN